MEIVLINGCNCQYFLNIKEIHNLKLSVELEQFIVSNHLNGVHYLIHGQFSIVFIADCFKLSVISYA